MRWCCPPSLRHNNCTVACVPGCPNKVRLKVLHPGARHTPNPITIHLVYEIHLGPRIHRTLLPPMAAFAGAESVFFFLLVSDARKTPGGMGKPPGGMGRIDRVASSLLSTSSCSCLALPTQRVNRRPAHTSEHKYEPCPRSD